MPDVGEGVVEGEISKWLVKVGDIVKEHQPLVEVITEKVTVELPSPVDGKVLKIGAVEGDIVEVGQTLVTIEGDREQPWTNPASESKEQEPKQISDSSGSQIREHGQVLATPAVRKLAKEKSIDLSRLKGSGPEGRVLEQDVLMAEGQLNSGSEVRIPFRGVRRVIAENLSRSARNVVQATCFEEVDLTDLIKARLEMKERGEGLGTKITLLSYVVKALGESLRKFPNLNSSLDEQHEEIIIKKKYNIGIAVDTDQGLLVPVLREVDKKDIYQIAKGLESLARKARDGSLKLDETHGGTFTITNVGSIGAIASVPLVISPQVGILAFHRVERRPVVLKDEIVARDMCYISISFDHRIVDGAEATRFLKSVKEYLEQPGTLIN